MLDENYAEAVSYLERGERQEQKRNFDRFKVPAELSADFFRLGDLHGKEVNESQLGMFREQKLSLQFQRDAMTTADPAKVKEFEAKSKEHKVLSDQFEARMIAAIRKQMSGADSL